jgi:hypothetical protein
MPPARRTASAHSRVTRHSAAPKETNAKSHRPPEEDKNKAQLTPEEKKVLKQQKTGRARPRC